MKKLEQVRLIPSDFRNFDSLTEDIDIGQYLNSEDCPIARALKRELKKDRLNDMEENLTLGKLEAVRDAFKRLKEGEEKVTVQL